MKDPCIKEVYLVLEMNLHEIKYSYLNEIHQQSLFISSIFCDCKNEWMGQFPQIHSAISFFNITTDFCRRIVQ